MVNDFIQRTINKLGYKREYFLEKNIPENISKIIIVPLFFDIRSIVIFSIFIFNQYRLKNKDYYLIVCSWSGYRFLFPQADEFWSLKDKNLSKTLADGAKTFDNESKSFDLIFRGLVQHFDHVLESKDIQLYFKDGFCPKYFEEFETIRKYIPDLPSSQILGNFQIELSNKQNPIVVFPSRAIKVWQYGECKNVITSRDFWEYIANKLIDNGFTPVLLQNSFTYDLSTTFTDKCLYLAQEDLAQTLTACHEIGCILDISSGISRLAFLARCAFVAVDERKRYINQKDNQFDDIFDDISKQYVFSLPLTSFNSLSNWDSGFLDSLIVVLKRVMNQLKDKESPSTALVDDIISLEKWKEKESKRFGVSFIKINSQEDK